jgi:hypothetical protein
VPFIDTHYRAVIDELVARANLCELNNDYDFNIISHNSMSHCTNLNSVSIIDYDYNNLNSVGIIDNDNDNDNVCFDFVSTYDNVQDNVNEFACNISGIDTNYDYGLHVSSDVSNYDECNGFMMLYCVKNAFCMRAKQYFLVEKIANGLLFEGLEFEICNFLDVNHFPCLHTQVYTGSNYSVIKCLALNVSACNFYEKYVCNFDCTSFC